ncbi:DUF389 domain-containing protein [Rubidibacter lacunae]|uniref:DUF389 domain-containing protein n=1 Tax=Rubidibacter lacunae TaxID=582514 RepID=UPI000685C8EE|nr:DUF389 domain-containing protein [Rubidibacter lacunae]
MLAAAATIATLGLIADSTAVIIGAMIVAPLMNPILSMAYSITTGNWTLYRRSILTLLLGIGITILLSFGLSRLMGVSVVGSEVLARTEPTLLDLGIAIAAGAAGGFALTRASIANSIAGVAIAVALVPPLCVVGIGLELGSSAVSPLRLSLGANSLATGALLLFLANLAGIIFTACLVFLLQSYGSIQAVLKGGLNWVLLVVLLCWPLWNSLREFIATYEIEQAMVLLQKDTKGRPQEWLLGQLGVELHGNRLNIEMGLFAEKGLISEGQIEALHDYLVDNIVRTKGVKQIKLKAFVSPIEVFTVEHTLTP